jgi:hypothetical protein
MPDDRCRRGNSLVECSDTGTETINADAESHATTIRQKYEGYLKLIQENAVKRPLFLLPRLVAFHF